MTEGDIRNLEFRLERLEDSTQDIFEQYDLEDRLRVLEDRVEKLALLVVKLSQRVEGPS